MQFSPGKRPIRQGKSNSILFGITTLGVVIGVWALAGSSGCVHAARQTSPAPRPVKTVAQTEEKPGKLLVGKEAYGSWLDDAPGVRRLLRPQDMPPPFATPSVDNGPHLEPRPEGAWPIAPKGFKVEQFVTGLTNPRVIVAAPNGDLFVAESEANRVRLLRDADRNGKPEVNTVFVNGLRRPFGIAFYPTGSNPQFIYIANTDSVVRIPYRNGDTKAQTEPQTVVPDLPGGGRLRGGGHWTRDLVFSKDNRRMYVSVGSRTNNADEEGDRRAAIHEYNPDGTGFRFYAKGVRNAVGLAIHPETGDLWCSTNERDGLGDDLPPEYVSRVKDGGFYGWPWYYIGSNWDPAHKGEHPELKDTVLVPDVLIQPHSASLDLVFYTGGQFPAEYRNDIFVAEHGSWNRGRRTGYKVLRVPVKNGKATGEYEDFVTGFVTRDGTVWGRPVGVATGKDGSLFITDDGSNSVWRVIYPEKPPNRQNAP
jgi:glucose/arabinose dehydrogenase